MKPLLLLKSILWMEKYEWENFVPKTQNTLKNLDNVTLTGIPMILYICDCYS